MLSLYDYFLRRSSAVCFPVRRGRCCRIGLTAIVAGSDADVVWDVAVIVNDVAVVAVVV